MRYSRTRIPRVLSSPHLRRRGKKPKLNTIIKGFIIFLFCFQCSIALFHYRSSSNDNDHDHDNESRPMFMPSPSSGFVHRKIASLDLESLESLESPRPQSIPTEEATSLRRAEQPTSTIPNANKNIRTLSNTHKHHLPSKCPRNLQQTPLATTLVTQTTLDRLQLLQQTCQRWSSPIVAVVYVTPQELSTSFSSISNSYRTLCPHMTLIPYRAIDTDFSDGEESERDNAYPINTMRNIGLDQVVTSHVLLIDADFIPSVDLDVGVKKAIQSVVEHGTGRSDPDSEPGIGSSSNSSSSSARSRENEEDSVESPSIGSRITAAVSVSVLAAKNNFKQRQPQQPQHHLDQQQQHHHHHHALVVPAYERKFDSNFSCGNLQDCLKLTLHNPEFMPKTMESLSKCVGVYNHTNTGSTDESANANSHVDGNVDSKETKHSDESANANSHVDGNVDSKDTKHSKCIVFHSDHFSKGHGNTESDAWLKGMDQEKVRSIPCISDGYEPYVVIPWCPSVHINHDTGKREHFSARPLTRNTRAMVASVRADGTDTATRNSNNQHKDKWKPISPYYDERFYGYGKNKIQQVLHLRARGYEFAVIPACGFLTHHPHPISNTRKIWKGDKKKGKGGLQTKMESLFKQYKAELKKEYTSTKVEIWTKFCPKKYVAHVARRRSAWDFLSYPLVLVGLGCLVKYMLSLARKKRYSYSAGVSQWTIPSSYSR